MQRSETADLVKQLRDALFLVDIDPECRDYAAKNQCVEAAIAAADHWLAEQPAQKPVRRNLRAHHSREKAMTKAGARLSMLRLDAKMKRLGARGWRKPKPARRLKSVPMRTAMKLWSL